MQRAGIFYGGDVARRAIKVKPIEIMRYWAPIFDKRYGYDDISEWLRYIQQEFNSYALANQYCFACGPLPATASAKRPCQRSHIVADSDGGSNTVENLHMLCDSCHSMSERLSIEGYWKWMDQMQDEPPSYIKSARWNMSVRLLNQVLNREWDEIVDDYRPLVPKMLRYANDEQSVIIRECMQHFGL